MTAIAKSAKRHPAAKKCCGWEEPAIYCLYIRSVAEQSCVVWFSAITTGEENDLERIQKVALRIILKENYISYESALNITNLETLKARRSRLAKKFAIKCTKNEKTKDMFPLKSNVIDTRYSEKYEVTRAKTNRLAVSSIPTMQKLLNKIETEIVVHSYSIE